MQCMILYTVILLHTINIKLYIFTTHRELQKYIKIVLNTALLNSIVNPVNGAFWFDFFTVLQFA